MTLILEKHGNGGAALVLDKAILDALGIVPGLPVEIQVKGKTLTVTRPDAEISELEMQASLEKLYPRYEQMLQNLAK